MLAGSTAAGSFSSGTGYYIYDEGYTPDFPGIEEFSGTVVHPQHWPEDLDYTGKKVVVIGSGATAVTLLPSLSDRAAKVTMLQRSLTYLISAPKYSKIPPLARTLLPRKAARSGYPDLDAVAEAVLSRCPRRPALDNRLLRRKAISSLPTVTTSTSTSNRRYNPWDQRLA